MKSKHKKAVMLVKLARQRNLLARCEHAKNQAEENKLGGRLASLGIMRKKYDEAFCEGLDNGKTVVNGYAESYTAIEKQSRQISTRMEDVRKKADTTRQRLNECFVRQKAMQQYAKKIHESIIKTDQNNESRMMDYLFVSRHKGVC